MELREFAEQVLFATTLEDKLRVPELITDARPGPALAAPALPGRPPGLRFKPLDAAPADFPRLHRLDRVSERGRLLHFFANHELLATELMALVLLRFPEAPVAFRRGVLQTLQDEQVHTRLYLERMRECGIEFGEMPVSGYFWRAVAPMATPMDYVAGLSLTFEQANLDFCRYFARGFSTVGDDVTARLLDRIYQDEIAHVAHGLKWFRRWKDPGANDWEAFCRQLKFPLSPSRAKGLVLNVEGRRAAGFDPAFVAELDVHSQSKGRTPGVFVFNPFAEGRIAHGPSFSPVRHQALLAADLANLPQFLGGQDDLVLVPKRPAVAFLSDLKRAGFPLPEFVELKNGAIDPTGPLAQRKLGRLRPWAWGPDSVELLAPLFALVTGGTCTADRCFNERVAQLYSKAWSAAFLREWLAHAGAGRETTALEIRDVAPVSLLPLPARHEWGEGISKQKQPSSPRPSPPSDGGEGEKAGREAGAAETWLCGEHEVGVAVSTLDEALAVIESIRRRGHHRIVVKEALGLAGHNAIRLWEPELLPTQRTWMAKALQNGRQLVIEPWLDRVLDFSVQLEMTRDGLKLCGYTGLINDAKGQFQANLAAPGHERRIPAGVAALFRERGQVADGLPRLYAEIFQRLEVELRQAGHFGPVGLDAFVYRTAAGDYRLKPIVELNPRYTMGRLTVELMKRTCPGSYGRLSLVSRRMAQAAGSDDFNAYARSLSDRFPLCLEGEPVPRIRTGALCLNDPAEAQVCLAVFQVARSAGSLVP